MFPCPLPKILVSTSVSRSGLSLESPPHLSPKHSSSDAPSKQPGHPLKWWVCSARFTAHCTTFLQGCWFLCVPSAQHKKYTCKWNNFKGLIQVVLHHSTAIKLWAVSWYCISTALGFLSLSTESQENTARVFTWMASPVSICLYINKGKRMEISHQGWICNLSLLDCILTVATTYLLPPWSQGCSAFIIPFGTEENFSSLCFKSSDHNSALTEVK